MSFLSPAPPSLVTFEDQAAATGPASVPGKPLGFISSYSFRASEAKEGIFSWATFKEGF